MKKLFVFLSIFAVLFISTIRPLHAEELTDNFTLINGQTYYFVILDDHVEDDLLIAIATAYQNRDVTLTFFYNYDDNDPLGTARLRYFNFQTNETIIIPLVYLGEIDGYSVQGSDYALAQVFSFTYSAPTITYYYEDFGYSFDTDNPFPPVSIYDTIYSIVNKFVFGNSIESGSHQDLIATLLSSIAVVFVFALPFLLVWKVVKLIMG